MDTSRDDFGIAIRSAFLEKGTQRRFSLFFFIVVSIIFIFAETIENKPLNFFRSIIKDVIYRTSVAVSVPGKALSNVSTSIEEHKNLFKNFNNLKIENNKLKDKISNIDYLKLENNQLRKLIEEEETSKSSYVSARVMLDKKSVYLNSFVISIGINKNIKKGMAVLDGKNFIGRVVDVNFFSSTILLISDLNSKIPIIIEPSGHHGILSGHGKRDPTIEYLPKINTVENGDKVYTSGKEGIFSAGIPIGSIFIEENIVKVNTFSDLSQITFINIEHKKINN